MTIFNRESFQPVIEKYMGSNYKEFQIIERELANIIKMVKEKTGGSLIERKSNGNHLSINITGDDINKSRSNKIIEQNFKKFFKLKDYALIWQVNSDANAFTPCATFQILDSNMGKDEDGRHTNENLFIGTVIYTGVITICDLNEKELMATLLHEIGHNFYDSVFQVLARIQISPYTISNGSFIPSLVQQMTTLGILDIFKFPELLTKGFRSLEELIKINPVISKLIAVYKDFFYEYNTFMRKIKAFKMIDIIKSIENNKGNFLSFKWAFLYNVEKHADSFAVDYGYGPYLASGLEKLRLQRKSIINTGYNIPGLNWMMDFFDVQRELIFPLFSGYPTDQNRMRTVLDRLNRSLKDPSLDPRVRKELEGQIKMYEEWYQNEYLSISKDTNKQRVFTWLYKNLVEKIFDGKMDVRELIHATDPKKYK